jgi:hypothetical protein
MRAMNPNRDSKFKRWELAGQISIRLTDKTIGKLNRMAKKSGRRRAEILRDLIESGIASEAKKSSSFEEVFGQFRDEVIAELHRLPDQLRILIETVSPPLVTPQPVTSNAHETPVREPAGSQSKDKKVSQGSSQETHILPADDPAGQNAAAILMAKTTNVSKGIDSKVTIQIPAGESGDIVGSAEGNQPIQELSMGLRLDAARIRLGYSIEKVSEELNLKLALTREILKANRDVPPSRAIRVEAKLQQWESISQEDIPTDP